MKGRGLTFYDIYFTAVGPGTFATESPESGPSTATFWHVGEVEDDDDLAERIVGGDANAVSTAGRWVDEVA